MKGTVRKTASSPWTSNEGLSFSLPLKRVTRPLRHRSSFKCAEWRHPRKTRRDSVLRTDTQEKTLLEIRHLNDLFETTEQQAKGEYYRSLDHCFNVVKYLQPRFEESKEPAEQIPSSARRIKNLGVIDEQNRPYRLTAFGDGASVRQTDDCVRRQR